ncbi:MAG TPA: hypothetical protein VMW63_07015 [Methanoregulaceae archaeon]|nr:hypothetical protein [Methanoregulaceae archaeon]
MVRVTENAVVYLICITFAGYAVQAVLIDDIFRLWAVLIPSVVLSLIPVLVEKKIGITFPAGLKSLVALSLVLHVAGGINRFYWKFAPFYDKFAHVISAAAVVMLVFCLFLILDFYGKKVNRTTLYAGIILISVFFMVAWEASEYFIDVLVKSSYNNGLEDTIGDLIADAVGLVLALALVRHHVHSVKDGEQLHSLFFRQAPSE